jgi:hypothetical protein
MDAIEDNYTEYDADQLGYRYDAWELTLPDDVVAHDRIALLDAAGREAFSPRSDLERLGLMHAHIRHDEPGAAERQAITLLEGERAALALAYEDIGLWLAKQLARRGELEQGLAWMDKLFGWMPDTPQESQERLKGEVQLEGGALEEADAGFDRSLGPQTEPLAAERAYEICALWTRAGDAERAAAWAQRCRTCAATSAHRAVLVDLALLVEAL